MKKIVTKNNLGILPAMVLAAFTLFSCSKWDDFKKYTVEGEILYTGKLDSAKVYSGKNRVRVTGLLNSDPKIVALKIFWNNKADSVVYEIKRAGGTYVFDQTFAVAEGIRTFTIYTYDAKGRPSVPVSVLGASFGDSYRRMMNNRLITSLAYGSGPAGDSSTINWDAIDVKSGALQTEAKYPLNNDSVTVTTPVTAAKTVLRGFNYQTKNFVYRTVYRPDSTSIDTFATPYMVR